MHAIENIPEMKQLILLSPEYYGIDILKPCILVKPLAVWGMKLLRLHCGVNDFLIKLMELFTINKWSLIDSKIIEDTRNADPVVAINLMYEMIFDKWRLKEACGTNKKVLLILGEHDRIIARKKMKLLMNDLKICKLKIIKKIGHTAVIEDFDTLSDSIIEYIKKDVHS